MKKQFPSPAIGLTSIGALAFMIIIPVIIASGLCQAGFTDGTGKMSRELLRTSSHKKKLRVPVYSESSATG